MSNHGNDSSSISEKDIEVIDTISSYADTITQVPSHSFIETETIEKVVVPKFSIAKREREDYNDYTPRTRYYVKLPKKYTEEQLEIIADSLLRRERNEHNITEIWVSYFLKGQKVALGGNSYGLSIRLRQESSSKIFNYEPPKPKGYNPPKARDLSNEMRRTQELWGAFDQGRINGYEVGYKDGKRRRKFLANYNSTYYTSDEWIEQEYKQGYEVGYTEGFDDAGGNR